MTERIGFNSILEDNEEHYYTLLEATINSVDEWASITIIKAPRSVSVRISPSEIQHSQPMLQEILTFHNLLKIKVNLSKSINTSSNIQYSIDI